MPNWKEKKTLAAKFLKHQLSRNRGSTINASSSLQSLSRKSVLRVVYFSSNRNFVKFQSHFSTFTCRSNRSHHFPHFPYINPDEDSIIPNKWTDRLQWLLEKKKIQSIAPRISLVGENMLKFTQASTTLWLGKYHYQTCVPNYLTR